MEIASIINKYTRKDICAQYLHRKVDLDNSIIVVGEPLKIVYITGSYFIHEEVVFVEQFSSGIISIETIKKIWILKN